MNYFKEIAKEMKVSEEEFVYGKGCKRTKKGENNQARYYFNTTKITDKTKYAIQYCKDIDQYIVWKVLEVPKRSVFSVIADNVPEINDDEIDNTRKGVEFDWKR